MENMCVGMDTNESDDASSLLGNPENRLLSSHVSK